MVIKAGSIDSINRVPVRSKLSCQERRQAKGGQEVEEILRSRGKIKKRLPLFISAQALRWEYAGTQGLHTGWHRHMGRPTHRLQGSRHSDLQADTNRKNGEDRGKGQG